MQINGQAIYNSKPVAPYEIKNGDAGTWVFTQVEKVIYAIWIPGENNTQPAALNVSYFGKTHVQSLNPNNKSTLKNNMLSVEIRNNPLNTPQVFRLN
jgi:hypothetical protein